MNFGGINSKKVVKSYSKLETLLMGNKSALEK